MVAAVDHTNMNKSISVSISMTLERSQQIFEIHSIKFHENPSTGDK
jgi:hypothetical protein